MISSMSIQIDGVEYLTTAEAVELAEAMGKCVSRSAVTQAANRWMDSQSETGISGAQRLGGKRTSPWIVPRDSFLNWLENKRDW